MPGCLHLPNEPPSHARQDNDGAQREVGLWRPSISLWPRQPLPRYYIYHFNVIYNHAQSSLSRTSDSALALDFTCHLVQRLEKLGYVNNYFHDRDFRAGSNLMTELERVLEGSWLSIMVLTPGFIEDCLPRYLHMSVFQELMAAPNLREHLIVVALGVSHDVVLSLLPSCSCVYLQDDWRQDTNSWREIETFVGQSLSPSVLKLVTGHAESLKSWLKFNVEVSKKFGLISKLHKDKEVQLNFDNGCVCGQCPKVRERSHHVSSCMSSSEDEWMNDKRKCRQWSGVRYDCESWNRLQDESRDTLGTSDAVDYLQGHTRCGQCVHTLEKDEPVESSFLFKDRISSYSLRESSNFSFSCQDDFQAKGKLETFVGTQNGHSQNRVHHPCRPDHKEKTYNDYVGMREVLLKDTHYGTHSNDQELYSHSMPNSLLLGKGNISNGDISSWSLFPSNSLRHGGDVEPSRSNERLKLNDSSSDLELSGLCTRGKRRASLSDTHFGQTIPQEHSANPLRKSKYKSEMAVNGLGIQQGCKASHVIDDSQMANTSSDTQLSETENIWRKTEEIFQFAFDTPKRTFQNVRPAHENNVSNFNGNSINSRNHYHELICDVLENDRCGVKKKFANYSSFELFRCNDKTDWADTTTFDQVRYRDTDIIDACARTKTAETISDTSSEDLSEVDDNIIALNLSNDIVSDDWLSIPLSSNFLCTEYENMSSDSVNGYSLKAERQTFYDEEHDYVDRTATALRIANQSPSGGWQIRSKFENMTGTVDRTRVSEASETGDWQLDESSEVMRSIQSYFRKRDSVCNNVFVENNNDMMQGDSSKEPLEANLNIVTEYIASEILEDMSKRSSHAVEESIEKRQTGEVGHVSSKAEQTEGKLDKVPSQSATTFVDGGKDDVDMNYSQFVSNVITEEIGSSNLVAQVLSQDIVSTVEPEVSRTNTDQMEEISSQNSKLGLPTQATTVKPDACSEVETQTDMEKLVKSTEKDLSVKEKIRNNQDTGKKAQVDFSVKTTHSTFVIAVNSSNESQEEQADELSEVLNIPQSHDASFPSPRSLREGDSGYYGDSLMASNHSAELRSYTNNLVALNIARSLQVEEREVCPCVELERETGFVEERHETPKENLEASQSESQDLLPTKLNLKTEKKDVSKKNRTVEEKVQGEDINIVAFTLSEMMLPDLDNVQDTNNGNNEAREYDEHKNVEIENNSGSQELQGNVYQLDSVDSSTDPICSQEKTSIQKEDGNAMCQNIDDSQNKEIDGINGEDISTGDENAMHYIEIIQTCDSDREDQIKVRLLDYDNIIDSKVDCSQNLVAQNIALELWNEDSYSEDNATETCSPTLVGVEEKTVTFNTISGEIQIVEGEKVETGCEGDCFGDLPSAEQILEGDSETRHQDSVENRAVGSNIDVQVSCQSPVSGDLGLNVDMTAAGQSQDLTISSISSSDMKAEQEGSNTVNLRFLPDTVQASAESFNIVSVRRASSEENSQRVTETVVPTGSHEIVERGVERDTVSEKEQIPEDFESSFTDKSQKDLDNLLRQAGSMEGTHTVSESSFHNAPYSSSMDIYPFSSGSVAAETISTVSTSFAFMTTSTSTTTIMSTVTTSAIVTQEANTTDSGHVIIPGGRVTGFGLREDEAGSGKMETETTFVQVVREDVKLDSERSSVSVTKSGGRVTGIGLGEEEGSIGKMETETASAQIVRDDVKLDSESSSVSVTKSEESPTAESTEFFTWTYDSTIGQMSVASVSSPPTTTTVPTTTTSTSTTTTTTVTTTVASSQFTTAEVQASGTDTRSSVGDWLLPIYKGVCHVISKPDMPYMG
ncbi:serine-rich adhesin for platelets [Aplysia californica]|uniref:Serine-rich adhesin for platelets n=1 Tax=Aplysia californica TaxID=6500 RepID=A0ABM0JNX7_APLCA|nr:serine-rich adhesin for platelets [Aplysia californica]